VKDLKNIPAMKSKKIKFALADQIDVITGQGTYQAKSVHIKGPCIIDVTPRDIMLKTVAAMDIYDQRTLEEDVVEEVQTEEAPKPKATRKPRTPRAKSDG
jgi:hypothetical protein